jgi:hypothetical protein
MKDLKAPKQDKTDFQGQTRVELAAEIRASPISSMNSAAGRTGTR